MTQTNGTANGHANGVADKDWWRQACVYQIYPRSFADANGDGIGDLKGITSKVPYLHKLGVDAVWLSPFYPSALKDGGYDVADYRDVDPKIGTLADFDEMMAAFEAVGIKVIVDIVPNHSSDDHVWFQEALKSPKGSNARERYIFRDGLGPDKSQPPSDWTCMFGGPAWDPVGDGQFYLHLFDTSQPDFNWEHPEVRADFLKTLRFWGDRGVSGFRVDVAHGLAKKLDEPMMPQEEVHSLMFEQLNNGIHTNSHPLWDRDEVHEIYKGWREVFNEYDPPLTAVAEAWVASDRKHLYASSDGLGQSFSFDLLACSYKPEEFRKTIKLCLDDADRIGAPSTWVFSNHDVVRHATRYGLPQDGQRNGPLGFVSFCREFLASGGTKPKFDAALGVRRARATTLMMLALPGCAYLYQGEELGLPEVVKMDPSERQDPTFFRTKGEEIGRDGCRVPLPWTTSSPSYGFSPKTASAKPHLPMPDWFKDYAVEILDKDDNSTLRMYQKALEQRKLLQTAEKLEWLNEGVKDVLHFQRPGGWEVIMNMSDEDVELPKGEVIITSGPLDGGKVPKDTTVWLKA